MPHSGLDIRLFEIIVLYIRFRTLAYLALSVYFYYYFFLIKKAQIGQIKNMFSFKFTFTLRSFFCSTSQSFLLLWFVAIKCTIVGG